MPHRCGQAGLNIWRSRFKTRHTGPTIPILFLRRLPTPAHGCYGRAGNFFWTAYTLPDVMGLSSG
jgi:hypothetical protein